MLVTGHQSYPSDWSSQYLIHQKSDHLSDDDDNNIGVLEMTCCCIAVSETESLQFSPRETALEQGIKNYSRDLQIATMTCAYVSDKWKMCDVGEGISHPRYCGKDIVNPIECRYKSTGIRAV